MKESPEYRQDFYNLRFLPSRKLQAELGLHNYRFAGFADRILRKAGLERNFDVQEKIIRGDTVLAHYGDAVWQTAVCDWTRRLGITIDDPMFEQIAQAYKNGSGLQCAFANYCGLGEPIKGYRNAMGYAMNARALSEPLESLLGAYMYYGNGELSESFYREMARGIASVPTAWMYPLRGDLSDISVIYPGSKLDIRVEEGNYVHEIIGAFGETIRYETDIKRDRSFNRIVGFIRDAGTEMRAKMGVSTQDLFI